MCFNPRTWTTYNSSTISTRPICSHFQTTQNLSTSYILKEFVKNPNCSGCCTHYTRWILQKIIHLNIFLQWIACSSFIFPYGATWVHVKVWVKVHNQSVSEANPPSRTVYWSFFHEVYLFCLWVMKMYIEDGH